MISMIKRFDGTDFKFLSNFWEERFEWRGMRFETSEHAYQACKQGC